MTALVEADVEHAALEWLAVLGWQTAHGPDIGPGGTSEERPDYGAVVLERRLRDALARLNPDLPLDTLDDAFRKLTRPEGSTLEARNRAFHRMLGAGVPVEYRTDGGAIRGAQAAVIDYASPPPTTSSRSTRSPSPGASTPAARTLCYSSTACRLA